MFVGACGNITKLQSRANLAPYCTLHTNEPVIGVIWKIVKGMYVGSPLSCNPGSDYGDLLALAHPFNMCGRFGLPRLQHNPVENHVTGTVHLLVLTLIMRLILVFV